MVAASTSHVRRPDPEPPPWDSLPADGDGGVIGMGNPQIHSNGRDNERIDATRWNDQAETRDNKPFASSSMSDHLILCSRFESPTDLCDAAVNNDITLGLTLQEPMGDLSNPIFGNIKDNQKGAETSVLTPTEATLRYVDAAFIANDCNDRKGLYESFVVDDYTPSLPWIHVAQTGQATTTPEQTDSGVNINVSGNITIVRDARDISPFNILHADAKGASLRATKKGWFDILCRDNEVHTVSIYF